MKFKGKLVGVSRDFITKKLNITFETAEDVLTEIDNIKDLELSIEAKKYRKHRSLDANGLLWSCLGEIAVVLGTDKWSVYLKMLKRYGKYTYILAKPNAVEAMKQQWRESEVIGEIEVNGQKSVQMLVYFGSSTYDTKEFSVLLDGVVSEMRELGLQPPPSKEMRLILEKWKK